MLFEGKFSGNYEPNSRYFPLYKPDKKICVFDVDDLLILQKVDSEGRMTSDWFIRPDANEVVTRALHDFDHVVLWSITDSSSKYLHCPPFNQVPQRISGPTSYNVPPKKHLKILSDDLARIVAFEDGERYFSPRRRTTLVLPSDDFIEKYEERIKKEKIR